MTLQLLCYMSNYLHHRNILLTCISMATLTLVTGRLKYFQNKICSKKDVFLLSGKTTHLALISSQSMFLYRHAFVF